MKESSKKAGLKSASPELPKPTKNDVLEACEMLRACMCLNRQAFSIVFMSSSITGEEVSNDKLKDFATKFDALSVVYNDIYRKLADVALKIVD